MDKLTYPNLRNGLVGAWCPSIDRSRSTLLIDQSGYNNHGTLTNMDPGTDWVASEGKVALDFDGTNDYVLINSSAITALTDSITVSAWVRPQVTTRSDLVSQWSSVGANQHFILLQGVTSSQFGFFVSSGSGGVGTQGFTFAINNWYHICGTYDRTAIKLFVNGNFISSNSQTFAMRAVSTATIDIGRSADAIGRSVIDDVRIYNRALLQSEIATLAQRRGIAYETYRVPVVRGASVGGGHNLTANGISTGAPSLGTPALTQVHALTANGISAGTPSAGTPTITQTHSIAATAISTGAPSLGTPALSQVHVFTATGISTGTPTLGTPLLTIAGTLVADNITAGVPTLGSPAITQVHGLLANAIATGSPSLGQPGLTQVHGFTATGIATGSPTLGSPSLSTSDAMIANGIVTGTPSLGSPSLSQVHVLVCLPVSTGAPSLGQPTIAQTHSLIAMGIVTGAPVLGSPVLDGVATENNVAHIYYTLVGM